MDDLISRKDVLDEVVILEFYFSHHDVIKNFCERLKIGVEKLPAADAVPVVRCKECFRRYSDMCPMRFFDYEDREYFDFTKNDYFCNLGEKERR